MSTQRVRDVIFASGPARQHRSVNDSQQSPVLVGDGDNRSVHPCHLHHTRTKHDLREPFHQERTGESGTLESGPDLGVILEANPTCRKCVCCHDSTIHPFYRRVNRFRNFVESFDMKPERVYCIDMSNGATKDHSGAKKGRGHWGRKRDAKAISNSNRRIADKAACKG